MDQPAQVVVSVKSKLPLMVEIGIAVVVAAGLVVYFIVQPGKPAAPSPSPTPPPPAAAVPEGDLGSTIYSKTQNPIEDKLPDTVAPVPNPLQNVYKNPFQ